MKAAVSTKTIAISFIIGALVLIAAQTVAAQEQNNQCAEKLSRAKIIEALGNDAISQAQIVEQVEKCKVNFAATSAARDELAKAGARAKLLDAIAENYRPEIAAQTTPAQPAPQPAQPAPQAATQPEPQAAAQPTQLAPTPAQPAPTPAAQPEKLAEASEKPANSPEKPAPPEKPENSPEKLASSPAKPFDFSAMPDYVGLPVTKQRLIRIFDSGAVAAADVVKVIEKNGVDFPMSLGNEEELNNSSYHKGNRLYANNDWKMIIEAVTENYRSDGSQKPQLVKAIRLYQTRKGADRAEKILIKTTALETFQSLEKQGAPTAQLLYYIAESYNELAALALQEIVAQKRYQSRKQDADLMKLIENAVSYHQKSVMLNPAFKDSWKKLAAIYLAYNEPEKALLAFKKLAALSPNNAEYWSGIGDCYIELKDFKNALAAKKQARSVYRGQDLPLDEEIEELSAKIAGQQ